MAIIPSDQSASQPASEGKLDIVQHAMRTKLGIILGSLDLLGLSETDLANDTIEDLARIKRAARDLLVMVDELDAAIAI